MGSRKSARTPRVTSPQWTYLLSDFKISNNWAILFLRKKKVRWLTFHHYYVEMLQNFLEPKLNNFGNGWFQQNGVRTPSKDIYGSSKRTFSRSTYLIRPQDLSPCNFFLWRYLRAEVFKHNPQTIDQFKDATRFAIAAISECCIITGWYFRNVHIAQEDMNLDNMIFKTKWWQYKNEMGKLVLSYNEIKFQLLLLLLF